MNGLERLNAQIRHELELLSYPSRSWVAPRRHISGAPTYNVVIIGAGQGGLATAFALRRECVDHILVIDERQAGTEGPWLSFARMPTLRTPKHLTGPDLGIPSLTFRAWYEAQYGREAWELLQKIPTELWARYLAWFRQVLDLPVQNGVRVLRIVPERDPLRLGGYLFRLELAERPPIYARRVVLATGIEGSGKWYTPSFIETALPKSLWAHTSEAIDFSALSGKAVGVLGAGASAFDNAAAALEAGAAEVHLFFRRKELPRANPYRWMEFTGFLKHFADLDDAMRWRMMRHIFTANQPPPQETFQRAARFANFYLHPASPWTGAAVDQGQARVFTPAGSHLFHFLIIGTGFIVDLKERPELASVEGEIARWQDRYVPPPGEEDHQLAAYPYLGPHFEFTERVKGRAPYLKHLYNFTFGATASMGLGGASISGMKYGVSRLVAGITRSFFEEDAEKYYNSLLAYDEPELEVNLDERVDHARPRYVPGKTGGRPADRALGPG